MACSMSVGKPVMGAAPDDAPAKPHHVRARDGTTTHFRNVHPSAKKNFTPWTMPWKMIRLPRRHHAPPVADLPFLDAVVVSHSHYDHLSLPTVREVARCFPAAHFFVGLGLARWFRDAGVAAVTELDWWEDAEATLRLAPEGPDDDADADADADGTVTVTATFSSLPAQHTSSRTGLDADRTLWCSWAVTSPAGPSSSSSSSSSSPLTRSVYFGGDTGYRSVLPLPGAGAGEEDADDDDDDWGDDYAHLPSNPDFAAVGDLRGPFDLGLLPIGAYRPRHLMSAIHADPRDAVEIFRDTRCRRALGIHWGTWALTTEPIMEPPRRLKEALRRRGLAETGVFDVCDIGESRTF